MQNTPMPTPTPTPTQAQTPVTPLPMRQRLLLALIPIAITLAALGFSAYVFFWPEYERSKLLETGVPAEATILSVEPTGNTYNDQPQVRIRLEVRPTDGAPYEAETKMIINPVYLPQFQPGKTVDVRYDAADRSKVAIEETESGQR